MKCYYCNAEIPDDAEYCPECGQPVVFAKENYSQRVCQRCGAPLKDDDVFCGECGEKVTMQDTAQPYEEQFYGSQDTAPQFYDEQSYQSYDTQNNASYGYEEQYPYGNSQSQKKSSAKIVIPIIAAVVVIAALVGAVFAFKTLVLDKKTDKKPPQISETEDETEVISEEEVDFDLTEDDELILEGLVKTTQQEDKVLRWEDEFSFYGVDFAGDKVLIENVRNAYIDDGSLPEGMLEDIRSNETVVIEGEVFIDGDRVYITPDYIYDEDGNDMVAAYEEKVEKAEKKEEEAKEEKEKEEKKESEYILADSASRVLSESDIAHLSLKEVNYAKNEIYARRGRLFSSPELQKYFNSKSWYNGTIAPESFSESMLSDTEKKNVELLKNREFSMSPQGYLLDQ